MALPTVAALWIGGPLTWLERLCLASFVAAGHPTRLYAYAPVEGVPEGVEVRDGREVLATDAFEAHERSGSVALFSDRFRYHLMRAAPGAIWVDTDVYCWRDLGGLGERVFGYETEAQLNGAVLALPPDSAALALLLDLTSDPFAIPPFYGPRRRATLERARDEGRPVHAAELPWGVWGPHAVTWALNETGEAAAAQARPVFYPVPFPARSDFFKRPAKTLRHVTEETRAIHIWGRIKRIAGKRFDGLAPAGSFLAGLLADRGIDPAAFPIRSHGRFAFGDGED